MTDSPRVAPKNGRARNLPGSWLSTSNSLLSMMALARNVLLPIDDFVVAGSQSDIDRGNREADRIFRAQGNRAGRGRCNRDGTPKETLAPQGLILSTGESNPEGHSLLSRILLLEVSPGDVIPPEDSGKFDELVQMGDSGSLASIMSGFIHFYTYQRPIVLDLIKSLKLEARKADWGCNCLPRTVDILGELNGGFHAFIAFAKRVGAISDSKTSELVELLQETLCEVAREQSLVTEEADPVEQFLQYISSALIAGQCHLRDLENEKPADYETVLGWRVFRIDHKTQKEDNSSESNPNPKKEPVNAFSEQNFQDHFIAQGECIGWIDDDDIYLSISQSLEEAQRYAKSTRLKPLPLSDKTLGKQMKAKELLKNSETDRCTTRVCVAGSMTRVLHIERQTLLEYKTDKASTTEEYAFEREKHDFMKLLGE
ncbi:hypothetical protein KIH39_15655 [Telmatocola sphagniphila]|uniref:Uncharacterized protein n=1 Tax=Telmatocola sphagniphila TaxID=1123043 RepID=A0A8E6B2V9_9BACT|nr:hypothetical protein [Telmatocola sphagniphila]QVL30287.1 hypothetical protein KIH39_15655 [Telmatocola sphagniphila]